MRSSSIHRILLSISFLGWAHVTSGANCTLCSSGSSPTNANETLPVPYNNVNLTCAALDSVLKSEEDSNSTTCLDLQTGLATFCGCTNVTTSACNLCSDGSSPTKPNQALPYGNLTCADLDIILKFAEVSTSETCLSAQTDLATLCGCPSINRTNSTNTLCPGICSNMAYPNRTVPPVPLAMGVPLTCIQAHDLLKTVPSDNEFCKMVPIIAGQFCGCQNAPPSCTPCYGNAVMPNYSKPVLLEGFPGTCGLMALGTAMAGISNVTGQVNETQCSLYQGLTSTYCDCPKSPKYCSVCDSNQKFAANANFTRPELNASCGTMEFGLNIQYSSNCSTVSLFSNAYGLKSQCCVKSSSSRFLFTYSWVASTALFSAIISLIM